MAGGLFAAKALCVRTAKPNTASHALKIPLLMNLDMFNLYLLICLKPSGVRP